MVLFYGEKLLALRPTPKLEDHLLSAVRDCLFNIHAATLHPQPADAPCRGDRDPVIAHLMEFRVVPFVSLMLSFSMSNEKSKRMHYRGKAWISFSTYKYISLTLRDFNTFSTLRIEI
jgi:hypothetical protein